MMTVNIAIEGWVGSDPREGVTKAGVPVASFRVAVNHRRENPATNEWETFDTSWYTVSAYGQLATNVMQGVKMRQPVVVAGTVIIRQWTDASGRSGTTAEITASSVGHNMLFSTEQSSVVAAAEQIAEDAMVSSFVGENVPF
jgi:single-strand DNA-binding protein